MYYIQSFFGKWEHTPLSFDTSSTGPVVGDLSNRFEARIPPAPAAVDNNNNLNNNDDDVLVAC